MYRTGSCDLTAEDQFTFFDAPESSMRPPLRALVLLSIGILLLGCGDCNEMSMSDQDTPDADAASDVGDTDAEDDVGDAGTPGPDCDPHLHCGDQCCSEDELCLTDGCQQPGDPCSHPSECADDQFCEVVMGTCLPEEDGTCEYIPDDDAFDPVVEQAWHADSDSTDIEMPEYNQVMMPPVVADINEDGTPNIIFSTFQDTNYNGPSVLRAIDGKTYEPVFDLTDPDKMVAGGGWVSVGDIDGDGRNEIVAVGPHYDEIIVFDDYTTGWEVMWRDSIPSIQRDGGYLVDLDGNGDVEIVIANRVYDGASGDLLCENSAIGDSPENSLAADLSGDGELDVVTAMGAFEFNRDGATADCPTLWTYENKPGGGFPAVADFGSFDGDDHQFGDFDGSPEVVTVSFSTERTVQLFDGDTGDEIWATPMPVDNHPHINAADCEDRSGGGPPTIADFTGDGYPEIATAGACFYAVFDMYGDLVWKEPTQDLSSRVTGSSVFDFQGNGRAEAVYADECFLRVYDGAGTGDQSTEELFKIANTTWTLEELPVIADVDGDYHTDIVLVANDVNTSLTETCRDRWDDFDELGGPSRGIRVVRDKDNRWVSSRPIWNQHPYSVTNVCDGLDDSLCPGTTNNPGAIPSGRVENWTVDHLNNYRQNVQGEGLFYAPDLTVTNMEADCPTEEGVKLEVTVANEGSRAVPSGLNVAVFLEDDDEDDELVVVLTTTEELAPGAKETLEYQWEDAPISPGTGDTIEVSARADDDGTGQGAHPECDETNNDRSLVIDCPCQVHEDCVEADKYCHDGLCLRVPG